MAESVTSEGALLLRTTSGDLQSVWSGDVHNLRTVSA
jgi:biotin-(acetyl-CoA carboxylase) ligase